MSRRLLSAMAGVAMVGAVVAATAGDEPGMSARTPPANEMAPMIERMEKTEKRIADLETRIGRTLQPATSVNTVEKRLQRIELALTQMESRLDQMEQRLRRVETKR